MPRDHVIDPTASTTSGTTLRMAGHGQVEEGSVVEEARWNVGMAMPLDMFENGV
jgi:hypothetical protein